MFALDTNILIYALKGKGQVREQLAAVSPSDIGVPAVVAYELEYGTFRSKSTEQRRRDLERLFSAITILPLDKRAADHAARVRYDLERTGASIGPLDLLIAGTALAFGATLVTNNIEEFKRVAGLRVENWF